MNLVVSRAGFLTTVQDLGRTGFRNSGVSSGGALDDFALRVANVLVGNEENAAGLELTFGTLRLVFADTRLIAWCGGAFEIEIEGEKIPPGRLARVHAGETLSAVAPQNGARAWLAISGGIDVPEILGSRSTDLRGQFGGFCGRALKDGDSLPLGKNLAPTLAMSRLANWSAPDEWSRPDGRRLFLRAIPGEQSNPEFFKSIFEVLPDSDRMAARLRGPQLATDVAAANLQSEPVAPGTVQLPPSGEPILLLRDCQTVGGYRKIAHVITADLPLAAQLLPGASVRFVEVDLNEAHRLLAQREDDFARFKIGIALRRG